MIFLSVLLATNILATIIMLIFSNIMEVPPPSIIENGHIALGFVVRMGGLIILLGTMFIIIAARIVTKPITKMSEVTKKITKGDFTARVPEISKGHDEITELSDNINLMVSELSRNEYLHKDFVSNVSHEFKTPIAAIQGYAEMLTSENLANEKRVEYAEIILNQSSRLSKLSSNLLRLSELENESFILKNETFSLDEQIRDAVLLTQTEWEHKNIDMQLDLEEIKYSGDKHLLYQVWTNLISNAIKFSKDNGAISITLKQGDRIKFYISDNGIGMTDEQKERIFERFYKADKARETSSTGLGLSIVKRIVEVHDGKIYVESLLGQGSNFVVML